MNLNTTNDAFLRPRRSSSALPWFDRNLLGEAACFGPDTDGFTLYVMYDAVDALRKGTADQAPHEAFGILLGKAYEDSQGVFTIVTNVVYAKDLDAGAVHVLLTPIQMAELKRRANTLYPAAQLVGWTHSHQCRSDYSPTDRDEQRKYDDYHVGILTFMQLSRGGPWAVAYRGPESRKLVLKGVSEEVIPDDQTFSPKLAPGDSAIPIARPRKGFGPSQRSILVFSYVAAWLIIVILLLLIYLK